MTVQMPRSSQLLRMKRSLRSPAARAYRRLTGWRARAARPIELRRYRSGGHGPLPEGTVMFWIPESGVGPHLVAMEVTARTLAESGVDVAFAQCHALFPRCPVMDMYGLDEPAPPEEAASCCDRCLYGSTSGLRRYGLDAYPMHALAASVRDRWQSAVASRPDDLLGFEFDGIAFGALALHDLTLANKLAEIDSAPDALHDGWWDRIRGCVHAYLMAGALCAVEPISCLVVFNDHAPQVSARLAAERHGIPVRSGMFANHRGVDRRRLTFTRTVAQDAVLEHAADWPRWADLALPPALVREVADDLVARFTNVGVSSHVFSTRIAQTASSVHDDLGLDRSRKTIVAFTSSLDEDIAIKAYKRALGIDDRNVLAAPFPDQLTWLGHLVELVEARGDLQLVVRVHPRESSHGRTSGHLALLRQLFRPSPSNVRVVWPGDPLSSYDVARIADVAAVSWSSIGLELARVGTPVIATTRGPIHVLDPDGGIAWEPTAEGFDQRLRGLVAQDPGLSVVTSAFRWYAFRLLGQTVDLSDLITSPVQRTLPTWRTPKAKDELIGAVLGDEPRSTPNLDRLRRHQDGDAAMQEAAAIRGQLGRVFMVLSTGNDPGGPVRLDTVGSHAPSTGPRVLTDGHEVTLELDGRTRDYWSPMEARLARLAIPAAGTGGRT